VDVELFHVRDLSGAISRNIYPVPSIWMLMRKPAMVLHMFSSFASREPGYFAIHHILFVRFRRFGCPCITEPWCFILPSFSSRVPGFFVTHRSFWKPTEFEWGWFSVDYSFSCSTQPPFFCSRNSVPTQGQLGLMPPTNPYSSYLWAFCLRFPDHSYFAGQTLTDMVCCFHGRNGLMGGYSAIDPVSR
jgi:hypothetical protein